MSHNTPTSTQPPQLAGAKEGRFPGAVIMKVLWRFHHMIAPASPLMLE
jgi:hypothetical protein